MIRHALKLIWNRKRQNTLVVLELVGSLLVLLALFTTAFDAYESWRRPVGFEAPHLWTVRAALNDMEGTPPADIARRFLTAVEELPAVEESGLLTFGLYTQSGMRTTRTMADGSVLMAENVPASPGIARALALEISEGRFFQQQDRGAKSMPIVVNRAYADAYFGAGAEAVGQTVEMGDRPWRVLGVVEHFRKAGELSSEMPVFFTPLWPDAPLRFGLTTLALRMAPDTPASFQEQVIDRLQAEAPDWSFDIEIVSEQRRSHLERGATPLAAGATVALFLLLMVGLGLTGVLWQNISRRTAEIGLRRAQGATAGDIRRQISLELLTLTLLSLALGGLLAVQLPILGLVDVGAALAAKAFALAGVVLVLLTAACSLYPGWLASRIQPAEALHHS